MSNGGQHQRQQQTAVYPEPCPYEGSHYAQPARLVFELEKQAGNEFSPLAQMLKPVEEPKEKTGVGAGAALGCLTYVVLAFIGFVVITQLGGNNPPTVGNLAARITGLILVFGGLAVGGLVAYAHVKRNAPTYHAEYQAEMARYRPINERYGRLYYCQVHHAIYLRSQRTEDKLRTWRQATLENRDALLNQ